MSDDLARLTIDGYFGGWEFNWLLAWRRSILFFSDGISHLIHLSSFIAFHLCLARHPQLTWLSAQSVAFALKLSKQASDWLGFCSPDRLLNVKIWAPAQVACLCCLRNDCFAFNLVWSYFEEIIHSAQHRNLYLSILSLLIHYLFYQFSFFDGFSSFDFNIAHNGLLDWLALCHSIIHGLILFGSCDHYHLPYLIYSAPSSMRYSDNSSLNFNPSDRNSSA